jgi:hypothetical protein
LPSSLPCTSVAMSSSLRRIAQQVPKVTRSFQSGGPTKGAHGSVEKGSHAEVAFGTPKFGAYSCLERGPGSGEGVQSREIVSLQCIPSKGFLFCCSLLQVTATMV